MKNLIFIITILCCGATFGQQKKSKKARFEVPKVKRDKPVEIPPPPAPNTISENENCFLFRQEEPKDSLVYVTENLLEYGRYGDNARIFVYNSNYDPVKKEEAEKQGMMLVQSETVQLIDGTFKIVKDELIFTSKESKEFKNQVFRLFFKTKTQKVDYLKDEKGNKYGRGKCHVATVSIGK